MNMESHRMEVALIGSNEIKFMLNTPSEEIDANILRFGLMNNVIPNLINKTLTVDFGVQYSYKDEPILECRYAFQYNYNDPDNAGIITTTEDGLRINDDLMKIVLNVAVGAIRGIMIARTAGTSLTKFPLPLLDLQTLMDTVTLLPSEE